MKRNHGKYCWEKLLTSFTRPSPLSHCSTINCPGSKFSFCLYPPWMTQFQHSNLSKCLTKLNFQSSPPSLYSVSISNCVLNICNRISYERKMLFTTAFPSLQHILPLVCLVSGSPGDWAVKTLAAMQEPACLAGDAGLIPGSETSPGEGKGNSLSHSCLGNHTDRGTWKASVHEIAKELDMT